jgi:hypothetical protein
MQQLLTPQQFAHQPMLDRDPPSIRRHEVTIPRGAPAVPR